MKLINILKESEDRGLSNEVKKHFLEIVSTYNKYQESMDRKSDIIQVAETLGGITEAARELALRESDDWFDKHTVKRNMGELSKLGAQFDKVAKEARGLDQRMNGLYEDMGNILSRYYKIGEISEDEMKSRLGIKESKEDCGCGCKGTTPGGCGDKSVNEILTIVDKFDAKKQDYDKMYYKDGGDRPGDGDLKKAKKELAKLSKKHKGLTLVSVGRNSKMYDVMKADESVNEESVSISTRDDKGTITTRIKEENELNEQEMALYEFGQKVTKLMEKSCPNDAGKWAASKAAAKKKFDVYPSAYANGWAAKNYKSKGGTWKNC